jgi:hypothetical protein
MIQEPQISVEQALRKGFWTVKVPSMSVLLVPLAIAWFGMKFKFIPSMGYEGMKWFIPTFVTGFVGSWLVWSIQVPRWRLWAYRRVKNISHLKARAAESQLIWSDGSIFQKTEIMSRSVREELLRLELHSMHGAD